jgi:hypothetical protein
LAEALYEYPSTKSGLLVLSGTNYQGIEFDVVSDIKKKSPLTRFFIG